jgi:hypothetical protein
VASMVLIQLLLVLMFAWPASRSGPHGLPVAVSGPASVTRSISTQLAGGRSGALDVTVVSSAGAARRSVLDRSNYGAVVFGPDSVTVYVASGSRRRGAVVDAVGGCAQECESRDFDGSRRSRSESET